MGNECQDWIVSSLAQLPTYDISREFFGLAQPNTNPITLFLCSNAGFLTVACRPVNMDNLGRFATAVA